MEKWRKLRAWAWRASRLQILWQYERATWPRSLRDRGRALRELAVGLIIVLLAAVGGYFVGSPANPWLGSTIGLSFGLLIVLFWSRWVTAATIWREQVTELEELRPRVVQAAGWAERDVKEIQELSLIDGTVSKVEELIKAIESIPQDSTPTQDELETTYGWLMLYQLSDKPEELPPRSRDEYIQCLKALERSPSKHRDIIPSLRVQVKEDQARYEQILWARSSRLTELVSRSQSASPTPPATPPRPKSGS